MKQMIYLILCDVYCVLIYLLRDDYCVKAYNLYTEDDRK